VARAPFAALGAVLLVLVVAGCGGDDDEPSARTATAAAPACPAAWKPGWQRLANRIQAPVFCPSWMPNPLTGEIDGPWESGYSVRRDRSYLVSFLWHEAGNDVHVNFRGYPGSTKIPTCTDTQTVAGVTHRRTIPCFSDRQRMRRIGKFDVTLYTVNQGVDQWHLLYTWKTAGSLYTLSEHVAPPFSLRRVHQNLERMLRGLARIEPNSS
jgi:hypothetical protein